MSKSKRRSKPGMTGECLEDSDKVLRLGLAKQSDEDDISPLQFEFSSTERKKEWLRISVWETSLTTTEQAHAYVENPARKLVMIMKVEDIRHIDSTTGSDLDVKWDRLENCLDEHGKKKAAYRTGCEGHCAIDGWADDKKQRKRQRYRLSELALKSKWYFMDIR